MECFFNATEVKLHKIMIKALVLCPPVLVVLKWCTGPSLPLYVPIYFY